MKKLLYSAIAITLLVSSAVADNEREDSPELVIETYFAKIKSDGMGAIGELMHPEEAEKFKKMISPLATEALTEAEGAELFRDLADPDDPTKLAELNGAEFMNRFLAAAARAQPELEKVLKTAEIDVIGHVKEGGIRHVVVRMKMKTQGIEIEALAVLSVKKHKGKYMMILTSEMKGLAQALKAR